MRGFIVKHSLLITCSFWLGSTVGTLYKVLVVGRSNWTLSTIPVVLLLRLPRYSMTFAVAPFHS